MSFTSFAAAQIIRALPRVQVSRAVGALADKGLAPVVADVVQRAYCLLYPVDMSEALETGPFPSFDAFFTRALKPGARSIDASPIVAPADGKLSAIGPVDAGGRIVVKRQSYDVAELVGDATEGKRYRGGEFCVVYLAPSDYHRVHSPVEGEVVLVRGIPGDLYPVNAIGEAHIDGLFVRNNRVTVTIETRSLGRVSVILVGATIVGRISVSMLPEPSVPAGTTDFQPTRPIEKGEELGMFHLGSTVVLLFEPGVQLSRAPGIVRYGESLMRGL